MAVERVLKNPLRSRTEKLADERHELERAELKRYAENVKVQLEQSIEIMNEKERLIRKSLEEFKELVNATYMPVSGDVGATKLKDFLINTNIVTVTEVDDALLELKDSRLHVEITADEDGCITLPEDVGRENIIDVSIIYPDNSTETLRHQKFKGEGIIHVYNHFKDDAAGRDIVVEYISLKSKINR